MARVIELLVLLQAAGGLGALLARRYARRSNVERVRELETENAEIDLINERLQRRRR